MSKYNISQIDIGDLISCKDKFPDRGYSTWHVVAKLDNTLLAGRERKKRNKRKQVN